MRGYVWCGNNQEGAILDGMEWDDPKQIKAIAIGLMEILAFFQIKTRRSFISISNPPIFSWALN
jgi:hypothetical protein